MSDQEQQAEKAPAPALTPLDQALAKYGEITYNLEVLSAQRDQLRAQIAQLTAPVRSVP